MRSAALLLLSLTVACTTDYEGLGTGPGAAGAGSGGAPNPGGGAGQPAATGGAAGAASGGAAGVIAATGGAAGALLATGGAGAQGGAGAAGGGGGAGNQAGAGGGGGQKPAGALCSSGAECSTGFCFDGTCCQSDCSGSCRSCANSTGTCTLAPAMSDPRSDCPVNAQNPCGKLGYCNGTGACAMAPAGMTCNPTPACDGSNTAVIASSACNGTGTCVPTQSVSCNGYLCAAGACQAGCTDDSACAPGHFCSAHACPASPANLAGNGDLETGTTTGWLAANGLAAVALSSRASSGYAHAGAYAIAAAGRSLYYEGPGYVMPTGLGQYSVSLWAMALQDTSAAAIPDLVAEIRLTCLGGDRFVVVQMGGFGMSAPSGTWIHFSADIDMTADPNVSSDCDPDGPGFVGSAALFVSEADNAGSARPDLYLDDLVIQSSDGHNLIGNPNFEAGVTQGWSTTGGASTLGVSSTVAHGGQRSLWQTARTLPSSAVTYALPLGAARYAVSLWARQGGTADHQLALLPLYGCIGSPVVHFAAPSAAVTASAGQWTQLEGTFVFPPADAPAGCVLSQAGVALGQAETGDCGSTVECPDLFVDDASITLK